MKHLFLCVALPLFGSDQPTSRISFDESVRPLKLVPKQELARERERPISVEPTTLEDELRRSGDILPNDAEPQEKKHKTFAQLMAERSFKCTLF